MQTIDGDDPGRVLMIKGEPDIGHHTGCGLGVKQTFLFGAGLKVLFVMWVENRTAGRKATGWVEEVFFCIT